MQVVTANGSTQDIPLYDYGTGVGDGVPVVFVSGVGVTQDPAYGTLAYQPGAVLTDDNGHWYQIAADWSIRLYSSSTAAPTTKGPVQPAPKNPVVPPKGDPNANAAQSTTNTLSAFFSQKLKLGTGFNVPYWLLAVGGVAALQWSGRLPSVRKGRR